MNHTIPVVCANTFPLSSSSPSPSSSAAAAAVAHTIRWRRLPVHQQYLQHASTIISPIEQTGIGTILIMCLSSSFISTTITITSSHVSKFTHMREKREAGRRERGDEQGEVQNKKVFHSLPPFHSTFSMVFFVVVVVVVVVVDKHQWFIYLYEFKMLCATHNCKQID